LSGGFENEELELEIRPDVVGRDELETRLWVMRSTSAGNRLCIARRNSLRIWWTIASRGISIIVSRSRCTCR
jgi:hypothetical protein